MARLEESLDLFGSSSGWSTCGDFTCAICGTKYNEGNDEAEDYDGDPVHYTEFAGVHVCYECFEEVENAVLNRMSDIIPWFKRLLDRRQKVDEAFQSALKKVMDRSS